MDDASEEIQIVINIMRLVLVKKAKCDTLKALLTDFGVEEGLLRQSKKTLAELTSDF